MKMFGYSELALSKSSRCLALATLLFVSCAANRTIPRTPTISPVLAQPLVEMSPVPTRLAALLSGRLAVEKECVRVNGFSLVWPPEISVVLTDQSITVVQEHSGALYVNAGDLVNVGGGVIGSTTPQLDDFLRKQMTKKCSGEYWLVSNISK